LREDLPVHARVRSVSGCMASSSRSPSTYGQSSEPRLNEARALSRNCSGSRRVVNSTYLAWLVGSTRFKSEASG